MLLFEVPGVKRGDAAVNPVLLQIRCVVCVHTAGSFMCCRQTLINMENLLPVSTSVLGSGTLFARPPTVLHAGPIGPGLGDELSPPATAEHRGCPEESLGS